MIILFGMAGSGKGTQGEALSEIFGWRWLSVGQVLRDSGKYTEILNRGELVTDSDVVALMSEKIDRAEQDGFDVILDGYPRNIWQAEWLANNGYIDKIDCAVILDVPVEELMKRLTLRARDDDKDEESIKKRFAVFEQNIYSMCDLLNSHGVQVVKVDGTGEIGEVTDRLVDVVKKIVPGAVEQNDDVNGGEIEHSYGE